MSSNNLFIISFSLHVQNCLKIHQLNITKIIKKDYKKKFVKDIKLFLKKKKKKSNNMVVNDTKIYQKMNNESLLSIEKNIIKREKARSYNYKKILF